MKGHAVAGEQGAQADDPFEYVPIGQVEAVKSQDVAPSGLKEPVAHGKHAAGELAPLVREKVPAAQGVQVELSAAPTNVLKVPGRQG